MKYAPTRLLALLALLAGSLATAAPAGAQGQARVTHVRPAPKALLPTPAEVCQLHAGPPVGQAAPVPLAPDAPKSAPTATISVTYNGFTSQAQEAFQRAVDIWARHIQSPITIHVEANFDTLGTGVLGSAAPGNGYLATVDGVRSIYPVALIEAITARDFNTPGAPDVRANFNSTFANWHFGAASPGPAEYDFTTVVLHELGHGLGFTGSMDVTGGVGAWGFGTGTPTVYDRFAQNGIGESLVDDTIFPNPSTELGTALTNNDVFFSGPLANRASQQDPGPTPPKLYAPTVWDPGSSFSHVDEATYPPGDVDALMTPRIGQGQAARLPGPIVCGIFGDMGWPLGDDCRSTIPVELTAFDAVAASDGAVTLTWTTASETNNAGFAVEQRQPNGTFAEVAFVPGAGTTTEAQTYRHTLANVPYGAHAFRLRQVDFDGTATTSQEVEVAVQLAEPYALAAYPNPIATGQRATIDVTAREAQAVTVAVYDMLGRRVAVLFDGAVAASATERLRLPASGLASGVYVVRVVGERFSAARRVTVVR
jgi:hypothetical protein